MQIVRKVQRAKLPPELTKLVVLPDMVTRAVRVGNRMESFSIEAAIWNAVEDIAGDRGQRTDDLVREIVATYVPGMAAESVIRAYVINHYRALEAS